MADGNTDEEALRLLREVRRHPEGLEARLAHIARLEQLGDPRAAPLRRAAVAQVETAAAEATREKGEALANNIRQHWPSSVDERPGLCYSTHFQQIEAWLAARYFSHASAYLIEQWGISNISLQNHPTLKVLRQIAATSQFACLRHLTLNYNALENEDLKILLKSRYMPQLEALDISGNVIGDAGAEALAECPALSQLETLQMNDNAIGTEGINALAHSSQLQNLCKLGLAHPRTDILTTDPEYSDIARSSTLRKLKYLRIADDDASKKNFLKAHARALKQYMQDRFDLRPELADKPFGEGEPDPALEPFPPPLMSLEAVNRKPLPLGIRTLKNQAAQVYAHRMERWRKGENAISLPIDSPEKVPGTHMHPHRWEGQRDPDIQL